MLIAIGTGILMTLAVIIYHYFSLLLISRVAGRINQHFAKSITVVSLIFLIHLIEIAWYSVHIYVVHSMWGIHGFSGPFAGELVDYVHVAASSYTTLGALSSSPTKELALVIDFISLTGFMMLTWSATFYYNIFSNKED